MIEIQTEAHGSFLNLIDEYIESEIWAEDGRLFRLENGVSVFIPRNHE